MNETLLFYEKQQFRQIVLWGLLIGLTLFLGYQIFFEKNYGNASFYTALIPLSILCGIMILFGIMKLETYIYNDRIELKFYPFQIHHSFPLNQMESMEVITYNPILDYGGWGIRMGAYNISGNKGLKIRYKNKNNYVDALLIGTQKTEELKLVLNKIKDAQLSHAAISQVTVA